MTDPLPPSNPYAYPAYPGSYGPRDVYGWPGYVPRPATDGLAIASLVISCVAVPGLCVWVAAIPLGLTGAVFGHVARHRMRSSHAPGGGLALAGIIVGWSAAAIGALILTCFLVLVLVSP